MKNFPDGWRQYAIPKGHKYRSIKCVIDGIKFPSKKEGRRYAELRLLQRAGKISDLKLQKRFPIEINGMLVCTYICDFHYLNSAGERITEDVKGFRTKEFILKKKLMKAVHGIEVKET